jgi:outer membrane protein assembly factor BamB
MCGRVLACVRQVDGNVYRIDGVTGAVVWSFTTGDSIEAAGALLNDTVIIGSSDTSVYCLDVFTGAQRWVFATNDEVSSPVTADPARGRAIAVSDDDYMYVLDGATGALQFSVYVGGSVLAPAVTADGTLVTCLGRVLTAFGLDGTVLWSSKLPVEGTALAATVAGDLVVLSVYSAFSPNVLAFNASTGALVWSAASGGDTETPPAVASSGLILVTGTSPPALTALHPATGAHVWTAPLPSVARGFLCVAAGDTTFVGTVGGQVVVVNATSGAVLYTHNFTSAPPAFLAVAYDALVVRGWRAGVQGDKRWWLRCWLRCACSRARTHTHTRTHLPTPCNPVISRNAHTQHTVLVSRSRPITRPRSPGVPLLP